MEMKEVVSTNINSVGYDEEKKVLSVQFKAGGTYEYDDVPKEEYEGLLSTESVGKYFSSRIRNKYVTRKIPV